ncbi:hypothetical protein [Gordonia sp. NPDC003376]
MGENRWRAERGWPPGDAVEMRWFLLGDRTAEGGASLATSPPL